MLHFQKQNLLGLSFYLSNDRSMQRPFEEETREYSYRGGREFLASSFQSSVDNYLLLSRGEMCGKFHTPLPTQLV